MRVHEETWEEYRDHWLEYERRKRDVAATLVRARAYATGSDDVTPLHEPYRPLTPHEYEDEILALCAELKL